MEKVARSEKHKMIGGVAGGLAEYFDIDPLIPRFLFIISLFWNGGGLLVYIILWIILPVNNSVQAANSPGVHDFSNREGNAESEEQKDFEPERSKSPDWRSKSNLIAGLILVFLGFLFLLDQFVPAFYSEYFWPLALVVIGVALLASGLKGND